MRDSSVEKILIVCFDFPPNQGIGGRRWAKFAKGLANKGVEVHVLKSEPVQRNANSPWLTDVDHPNIKIHSLPRTYPQSVSHPRNGWMDKLRYRRDLAKLKKTVEGTIYDLAATIQDSFSTLARELIVKHDIEKVAVTGAPFNLIYYTALLKDEFPNLRILADYRDPWLTARNYGMADLSEARMNFERQKQEVVFSKVNVVTCPNEFLLEEIRNSSSRPERASCSFEVLPHSYDSQDLEKYLSPLAAHDKIRMVYGGAIYLGLKPIVNQLVDWLDALKSRSSELYDRLQVDFYSPDREHVRVLEERHPEVVCLHDSIGKDLFKELNASRLVAIFLADHNKDYLTTKFFEMLPFQKPMAIFGPRGYAAEFIEDKRLGAHISDFETFEALLKTVDRDSDKFNTHYPHEKHSLDHVTGDLIRLLS